MTTTCNNCLDDFTVLAEDIKMVVLDGLEIQFFRCPSCGRKLVIFVADGEMKELVAERDKIQGQLRLARIGGLRKKTVRRFVARQNSLANAQKKRLRELKPRAERLLKEADHVQEEVEHKEQSAIPAAY